MDWVAGFVFFGLPFALFAVVPLRTLARAWADRGSAHWSTVAGRVTAVSTGGDNLRSHQFSLRVRYRYTVEGEDFRGSQEWRETPPVGRAASPEEVFGGRYAAGQRVAVRHHPRDPARSLIEPDSPHRRAAIRDAVILLAILALAAVAIPVFLAW